MRRTKAHVVTVYAMPCILIVFNQLTIVGPLLTTGADITAQAKVAKLDEN
jgi:hypothetical protein